MELFVTIVNGFQPLTIITKRSILDIAAALDPPLGIEIDQQYLSNVSNISDPVEKAIKKYKHNPSISIINKMVSSVKYEASFPFTCVTLNDISTEIKLLDIKKANQESDIPKKNYKAISKPLCRLLTQKY